VQLPVTLAQVKRAYRARALESHPDRGGSTKDMINLNAAYEQVINIVGSERSPS
jgi:hypothetical protein